MHVMNWCSCSTVWQIAQRDYKFGKGKHRSLTKATYDAVGNHFRSLWGKEAGWAHSVLFTADLRAFSERLQAQLETREVPAGGSDGSVKTELVIKAEVAPALPIKSEENEAEEKPIIKTEHVVALENEDEMLPLAAAVIDREVLGLKRQAATESGVEKQNPKRAMKRRKRK